MPTVAPKKSSSRRGPRTPDRFSEAEELYGIDAWGKGFFSISDEGHLLVHPTREGHRFADLKTEGIWHKKPDGLNYRNFLPEKYLKQKMVHGRLKPIKYHA